MVSRSNSFIGTIKSILPTKLPWFGSSGNQADAPSKRKQVEERPESEEGARSNKRQRVDESLTEARKLPDPQSRVPQSASAYLDPPTNAFGSAKPVRVPRASPLHVRSSSAAPSRSRSRMNMSPGLVGARAQAMRMTRTQSMDPPSRYRSTSYRPALSPMPISRDASMEDLTGNDSPTSPNRPFRMRTSLTPALAEQEFGPHPTRRERDGSEPPPLAVLIENPVFVKAPSEAPRHSTPMARQGSLTLGAVVDAQRQVKPVQRQHSALMIGAESNSMQDVRSASQPAPGVIALNTAERALRELEVYKTPLLPTRLRGSNTVPDMFKPKRGKPPVLMHDRDQKPRLGMADKTGAGGKAEEGQSMKPYAGRGGMKKLLERRKQEEQEEQEKANSSVIETEVEEETRRAAQELNQKLISELQPAAPEPEPVTSIGGREQPPLRVGRTRISRNHIARPKMRGQAGRFSAIDEEEEDDAMDDGAKEARAAEQISKLPAFQPPPGFSFARETPAPIVDSTSGKEPPLSTLPFSLGQSTSSSAPTGSSSIGQTSKSDQKPSSITLPTGFSPAGAPTPPAIASANSTTVSAPAPLTPLLTSVPQIALIPPSPSPAGLGATPSQPLAGQQGAGKPAVPNFFANSSFLSKPSPPVTPPSPSFSLTGPASTSSTKDAKIPAPFFSLGGKSETSQQPSAAASSTLGSAFGTESKKSTSTEAVADAPRLQFGITATATSAPASVPPTLFTASAPTPASEQPKEKDVTIAPAPSMFTFNTPSKVSEKPTSAAALPFSFGTPVKATDSTVASPSPSPAPFSFSTPTKDELPVAASPFSFSTPTKVESALPESGSRPQTAEAPKSLFGAPVAPQPTTPFGGFTPSTPEPPKAVFTFGKPAAPAPVSASTTPVPPAAPKPSFGGTGGFSFGPAAAATSAPTPTKSPFSFNTAPSTPTVETKPFTFGAPATSASPNPFGPPANAAPATNKPFAFGASAPRETTPPKKDDSEVMMDESPVRPPSDLSSKPELPKLNPGGFSFNLGGTSSPFTQSPQTASSPFSFGQPPASSTLFGAKPEVKPAEKAPTPFSFGQSAAPATTGFAFGQKPAENTPAAPAAPFSFSPATPTAAAAPFGFGAPQISQSNSFGAATPVSPFGQPTTAGFNFSAAPAPSIAPAASNAFSFTGSQPASPAATNTGLPGQNGATGFAFGAPNAAPAASSPFGTPAALPEAGPTLFTMGAAPPAGPRPQKGLPKRLGRGAKR